MSHYVHRLVARAFIGEGGKGEEVCHRDGNKVANAVENLYWGTRLDNMVDRNRLGESAKGQAHGMAKLREDQAIAIIADNRLHRDIAIEYGVSRSLISMMKRGKIWSHLHG